MRNTTTSRCDRLATLIFSADEIAARALMVSRTIMAESPRINSPRFTEIDEQDLERLFQLYDQHFFDGWFSEMIQRSGGRALGFRLSSRMTRSAGKTLLWTTQQRMRWQVVQAHRFEIVVSSFLLFRAFRDDLVPESGPRLVSVAGVVCSNRLEALLRIFEHELLHLAEFLATGRSSCSATPFRNMSRAIFGHEASVHTMITPQEMAALVHSIALGDRVAFEHRRIERRGFVTRITKRATVLVADRSGRLYSDGNRYTAFLVPLDRLRGI